MYRELDAAGEGEHGKPEWDNQFAETEDERNERLAAASKKRLVYDKAQRTILTLATQIIREPACSFCITAPDAMTAKSHASPAIRVSANIRTPGMIEVITMNNAELIKELRIAAHAIQAR